MERGARNYALGVGGRKAVMEREARNYALGGGGMEGGNGARSAELRFGGP